MMTMAAMMMMITRHDDDCDDGEGVDDDYVDDYRPLSVAPKLQVNSFVQKWQLFKLCGFAYHYAPT